MFQVQHSGGLKGPPEQTLLKHPPGPKIFFPKV